jgi:aminopeptidase N
VYLNGAVFLGELRSLVGDDIFFAFLKDYAERYAGKIATRGDFFGVLAQHTDVDLAPLLAKYFINH